MTQVGAPTDHGRLLPRHDGLLHRPRKLACSCHAAAAAGRRLLGVLASVVLGALQPLLHTPGPKPGAAVCRMAGWSCGRWTTQAPGMTTRVPRCARWSWRAAMPFCERRPWGCPGGKGGGRQLWVIQEGPQGGSPGPPTSKGGGSPVPPWWRGGGVYCRQACCELGLPQEALAWASAPDTCKACCQPPLVPLPTPAACPPAPSPCCSCAYGMQREPYLLLGCKSGAMRVAGMVNASGATVTEARQVRALQLMPYKGLGGAFRGGWGGAGGAASTRSCGQQRAGNACCVRACFGARAPACGQSGCRKRVPAARPAVSASQLEAECLDCVVSPRPCSVSLTAGS